MTSVPRVSCPPSPLGLGRGGGSADLLLAGNRYGCDSGQRGTLDRRYRVLIGGRDRPGNGDEPEMVLLETSRAEIPGLRWDEGLREDAAP